MPLFEITALSQFKITYFIEADTVDDALDEHTMNVEIVEAAQDHLGERVMDIRKISRKKFDKWLVEQNENPGMSSYWMGEKLINVVPSAETPTHYSAAMDKMSQSLQMGTPDTEEPFDDGGPYTLPADPYGY